LMTKRFVHPIKLGEAVLRAFHHFSWDAAMTRQVDDP
jgi:hypothetical protein